MTTTRRSRSTASPRSSRRRPRCGSSSSAASSRRPDPRWWPAWRGDPEATVRDLLGHTSGMRDPSDARSRTGVRAPARASRREYIAATTKPGPRTEDAEYSNAGFVLAGLILGARGRRVARGARPPRAVRRPRRRRPRVAAGRARGAAARALVLVPARLGPAGRRQRPQRRAASRAWGSRRCRGRLDGRRRAVARALGQRAARRTRAGAVVAGGDARLPRGRVLAGLRPRARQAARSTTTSMWGHGGDGFGSHSELWYMPKERITVAVAWNDDLIDSEGRSSRSSSAPRSATTSGSGRRPCWPAPCGRCRPCA